MADTTTITEPPETTPKVTQAGTPWHTERFAPAAVHLKTPSAPIAAPLFSKSALPRKQVSKAGLGKTGLGKRKRGLLGVVSKSSKLPPTPKQAVEVSPAQDLPPAPLPFSSLVGNRKLLHVQAKVEGLKADLEKCRERKVDPALKALTLRWRDTAREVVRALQQSHDGSTLAQILSAFQIEHGMLGYDP